MAQVAHGPQRDQHHQSLGLFPQIGLPHNGWFMMENIIKIDDLGATFFIETPIWSYNVLMTWVIFGLPRL